MIKEILQLLEASISGENMIDLDTSKKHTNNKGQIVYGDESDYGITYNAAERHFSCYVHALINQPGDIVKVRNMQTKNVMTFKLTKIDKDGSGEDTYGWNYECTTPKGKFTLLIIND